MPTQPQIRGKWAALSETGTIGKRPPSPDSFTLIGVNTGYQHFFGRGVYTFQPRNTLVKASQVSRSR